MNVYRDAERWRDIADDLALELENHCRAPGVRDCPDCRAALRRYEEAIQS